MLCGGRVTEEWAGSPHRPGVRMLRKEADRVSGLLGRVPYSLWDSVSLPIAYPRKPLRSLLVLTFPKSDPGSRL